MAYALKQLASAKLRLIPAIPKLAEVVLTPRLVHILTESPEACITPLELGVKRRIRLRERVHKIVIVLNVLLLS
jgi:ribosomal protein S6E (S10)